MKIRTKGHYAVAAMIELVKKSSLDHSKPVPLNVLAENQNLSVNYLEQLFSGLKKKSLVKSIRGAQGGYLLARPAVQITVLEILQSVGESIVLNPCKNSPSSGYCFDQKTTCAMHNMWQGLSQTLYDYLDQISLDDLSKNNLSPEEKKHLGIDILVIPAKKLRAKKIFNGYR